MALRNYQKIVITNARRALTKDRAVVLQMPTGAGKTRVASEMVATTRGVVWFVCHRREIIRQASKAFAAAGIDFGVVSRRYDFQPEKRVQIASVQTLANRMAQMKAPGLVVWDECHHVAAKSWSKIREATHSAKHLGLTATPERLDGKGLQDVFASLVIGHSIRKLIDAKYLSNFRYFAPSEPDLTNAKMRGGDYAKADVGKIMNSSVLIGDAVSEYKKNLPGKRALVFAASVKASKAIVRRFRKENIAAVHIDGTTPTAERDAAVADMTAGRIKVLSNVEVFTEGFDLPAIDAVILMRPTKSLALFLQMVGRALRPAPGKKEALIFDHAGLWLDHGMPDADWNWSLEGKARETRIAAMKADGGRLRRCPECKEVHVERRERCGCGYVFKTGREIGEYDGQLYELRNAVPDGYERVYEFSQRFNGLGTKHTRVVAWKARGLPHTADGYIHVSEGLKWVEENVRMDHPLLKAHHHSTGEYEAMATFGRRAGVSVNKLQRWVKKGLLPSKAGWIHILDGMKWLEDQNRQSIGLEPRKDIAKRFNVSQATVDNWVKRGLPLSGNGLIAISVAETWVGDNVNLNDPRRKVNLNPRAGFCNKIDFALKTDVARTTVDKWFRRGIPTDERGHINVVAGLRWVELNSRMPSTGIETQTAFARRVGCSQGSVHNWIRRGLPCAPNGCWVHIQRGLEWVRDNTSVTIPPRAWSVQDRKAA